MDEALTAEDHVQHVHGAVAAFQHGRVVTSHIVAVLELMLRRFTPAPVHGRPWR